MDVYALNGFSPPQVYPQNQPHKHDHGHHHHHHKHNRREDNIRNIGITLGVGILGSVIANKVFEKTEKKSVRYAQVGIIALLLLGLSWFAVSGYTNSKRKQKIN